MFAGTFQDAIIVRLGEDDRVALLKLKGAARFEPMQGRPMKEYVVVPASVVDTPKHSARGSSAVTVLLSGSRRRASRRSLRPRQPA
jgi:hypothetical protein